MNKGLLVPKRSLISGKTCPDKELACEVVSVASDSAEIVLKVEEGMLEKASLDAIYELIFEEGQMRMKAEGRILRRDQSSRGDIIIFNRIHGLYRL